MAVPVWPQPLDPRFPLAVVEYAPRGEADPMHWHDHLEIALVLEGRGTFLFGRRRLAADEGDIFLVDNSQPHVAWADRGARLRLLLVLFRHELLAGVARGLDDGYLEPFRGRGGPAAQRIRAGSRLAGEVAPLLGRLRALGGATDPSARLLADATLRLALALVSRDTGGPHPPRGIADRRAQVRPVLAYVDRHCRDNVTLAAVADVVHASPSRVRHVFKDVTGVSFKEYVTQVRLAEAKRLLLTTELSVAAVADSVSYTNLHQFYKVFRRTCAMSPAAYRRYYAEDAPEDTRWPS